MPVRMLVADEADRLLDLGFREPLQQLLNATHRKRQTACVTATWGKQACSRHAVLVTQVN